MTPPIELATVRAVRVGRPRELTDEQGRSWHSAFLKDPAKGPVALGFDGLAGDEQADLRVHGGPDKAVCVYPLLRLAEWERELDVGPLGAGAFGENFSVDRITEAEVCIGDVWEVGGSVVQVSQPRGPCWKLARRWAIKDLAVRFQRTGHTGWYLRVLQPGLIHSGQAVRLLRRPHPDWTVLRANRVHYGDDSEEKAALASCPELGRSWRTKLAAGAADPAAVSSSSQHRRLFGPSGGGHL
ncbi:MOSC domain-containing protein [Pseudonocardia asaccharolytica]|uniref:Molybdenum cofactor sulfurase n=1 Tax=Pseudonocardia asaccharolytica DSM 44247 = NBRC 16224 TaxID=1123024 RepID=A0A511D5L0_9PSEU|nr:MOSC domain-containing protein [Pseudonocardia asaccharolytica]GEL20079.1 molybdenum cofactor sulfurase [Pseudonocardia asaccharolytica DSM 44247 = NBRC 16224]